MGGRARLAGPAAAAVGHRPRCESAPRVVAGLVGRPDRKLWRPAVDDRPDDAVPGFSVARGRGNPWIVLRLPGTRLAAVRLDRPARAQTTGLTDGRSRSRRARRRGSADSVFVSVRPGIVAGAFPNGVANRRSDRAIWRY